MIHISKVKRDLLGSDFRVKSDSPEGVGFETTALSHTDEERKPGSSQVKEIPFKMRFLTYRMCNAKIGV